MYIYVYMVMFLANIISFSHVVKMIIRYNSINHAMYLNN